jgi:TonB family protein
MKGPRDAISMAVLLFIAGCSGCSSPMTPSKVTTVYEEGSSGVTLPTVLREVKPSYTSAAIRNRIEGTLLLAAVVLSDGTVGEVTILQPLDTLNGLDAQAVIAVKQWLFTPGMKDGVPVAVRVTIEMAFRLTA